VSDPALTLSGWVLATAGLITLTSARRSLVARRRSVAQACHELRGPLSAATLGVELAARQGNLDAARLRAIELELRRAALAVEELELGAHWPVGAGRVGFGRPGHERGGMFAVGELVAESVEAWRPAAAERGVELRLRWSGPDALIAGDRVRLAQATGNLIANAIEHGGGEVEISGRAGAGGVRIEIVDGGAGLAAPVAELIRRAPRDGRHGHGLRIARAVAAACGGRLAAAPSDRGARLVLELPAAGGSARTPSRRT
jgi:signal transduction histidine kinase